MKPIDGKPVDRSVQLAELPIYQSYKRSKYLSIKHSSYFQVYEELLDKYRNRPIIFVEIGVLNGGSLFMWRDYLGPEARIIGLDFNPQAKHWQKDGFEIFIGNQADPNFWSDFFLAVGNVDVLLDDGGHTNEQQIVTAHETIPHIRDGGVMIVEDTHTNYAREFGFPSPFSFTNYAKGVIDGINSRSPSVRASKHDLKELVWSLGFYESIVSFHVDRTRCFVSSPTSNGGQSLNAEDFRHHRSPVGRIETLEHALNRSSWLFGNTSMPGRLAAKAFRLIKIVLVRWQLRKLKKYFH